MLQIRNEQMETMRSGVIESFVESACLFLQTTFRDEPEFLPFETLEVAVRQAIDRCHRYGIDGSREIVRYAAFMIIYGENFETTDIFAGAVNLLSMTELPPWHRLDRLQEMAEGAAT
jgi:hypothetical protein